jgi:hypothetical protein
MRPAIEDLQRDKRVPVLIEKATELAGRVLCPRLVVSRRHHRVGRDRVDADLGRALHVFEQLAQCRVIEHPAGFILERLAGGFRGDPASGISGHRDKRALQEALHASLVPCMTASFRESAKNSYTCVAALKADAAPPARRRCPQPSRLRQPQPETKERR